MRLGLAKNTYAILIGIEQYGESGWELNGPAMDALRMATWLLSKDVPAANIRVYINEGTQINDELARQRKELKEALVVAGVDLHGNPVRSVLDEALAPENLPTLPGLGDKTLIIYVCGHGLWEGGGTQRRCLVTADASLRSCHVVDLTFVANQLCHHSSENRFTHQWLIQDACATLPDDLPLRSLGTSNGPRTVGVNLQYMLCAARPGEAAINDSTQQAGQFTAALLEALTPCESLEGVDVDSIRASMATTHWGRENRTSVYSRDEGMQESTQVWGSLITGHEALLHLNQILGSTRKITSDLLRTVARTFLGDANEYPKAVMPLLRLLDSLVASSDCVLTTVEQFVIQLYAVLVQIGEQSDDQSWDSDINSLRAWIDKWPGGHDMPAVIQQIKNLNTDNLVMAHSEVIVIDLSESETTGQTRVWGYCKGVAAFAERFDTPQATLKERLRSALEQICADMGLCGNTVFEVVLPASKVFEPYTGLEFFIADNLSCYLGHRPALLALRILERWHNLSWKRPWLRHWETADVTHDRVPTMVWLQPQALAPAGESGWSWHGTINLDTDKNAIERSLRAGVACAAWCEPEHFENVTNIVQGEPYVRLLNTRISLADLNTSDRHGVTCILDTPERIPPGAGGASSGLIQPSVRTSA